MASDPVISVVAPPGYGKTTLLAQYCEAPLAVALNGIQPIDQAVFAALVSTGAGITSVPRLA